MTNAPSRFPFSFEPLTPVSFLSRSALVFATDIAVIEGNLRFTYRDLDIRSKRLAFLLRSKGVNRGDRVAVLASNNHVMLESHYGVPIAEAVLVTLNTRLAISELVSIVNHSGCKVIIHDVAHTDAANEVAMAIDREPTLLVADERYENSLIEGPGLGTPAVDELSLLAINYTSGTTGAPKGVMYHHRGAYLQSLAMTNHFDLDSSSKYLWTLPMFHCNGWCFTWAVTAAGGTHVCMPDFDAQEAWRLISEHSVTHFCAAPTVLTMLTTSTDAISVKGKEIRVAVGGAPPSPSLIAKCETLGLSVTHLYGLTETFGPVAICDWKSEWVDLPSDERSLRRARQGVGNIVSHSLRVVDASGSDVPRDGVSLGEIIVRGNNVMLGYYNDDAATNLAVTGGWFHTGDIAVMHQDSYVEIRDRAKDVIISGGENISSLEVEFVLVSHRAVLEAAVVSVPHEHWGERPIAFVTLNEGESVSEDELRNFAKSHLARFKVPDHIIFGSLPKTSTGKIQKQVLRSRVKECFD
ncbi:MAG: AMP-binding protein [Acidimicrobiales bacterium]